MPRPHDGAGLGWPAAQGPGARRPQARMRAWRRWWWGGAALLALLALLFGRETRHAWRDVPPAASSIEQLQGSLTRNLFIVRGLSLDVRFRDGFRLLWTGDASHVPAGLVESESGVHLVLEAWAVPRGQASAARRTLVCWVRDAPVPAGPVVVVPLFTPEPLVSALSLNHRRFMTVDDAVVRAARRRPADELLRHVQAMPQAAACPNLALARSM